MNGRKYILKSLGGHDSDNSIDDYIFFCEPRISGCNNEGYVTKYFVSVTKMNAKGISYVRNEGDEILFKSDLVENFTFKRYIRTNMSLMATGKIYNKNRYRHELNNKT